METVKRPKTKRRGARLFIVMATLFFAPPSCARLEGVPSRASGGNDAPGITLFAENQSEVGRMDIRAADQVLKEAYLAALENKLWESMFEVGDGYLKIGEAAKARRCFLIAFYRARGEGSLDGVLRVAEALAVLGDREMTAQAAAAGKRLADETSDRDLPGVKAAAFSKVVD